MNCNKCNALIPDDSVFCPECGQKIEIQEPAVPVELEMPIAAEEMTEAAAVEAPEAEPAKPQVNIMEKLQPILAKVKPIFAKIPPKFLKIGAAAIALILVISIVASLFGGAKTYNYALYIQDGQVQYAEMPKGKDVIEVTSDFASDVSNYYLSNSGYELADFFHLSSDGKKLFYADKMDDDGYTLYYRDITNSRKDPVKIESNLEDYCYVNEKGTLVTYIKDGKLYQHDLKEKTKIASDVDEFAVSDDGKTLLYTVYDEDDESYTIYSKKGSKDASKLASSVDEICHVSEDLSMVVYIKSGSLYLHKIGKDATKIASDVDDVITVYDSGEIYYTKEAEDELTYWDLIEDDYQNASDWSYEYYSEWMKESTLYTSFSELCYYNGKDASTVTEVMVRYTSYAGDEPVLVYSALDSDELPTWSLTSYINGEIDLYDEFKAYMTENSSYFIAAGASVAAIEQEDIYSVSLTGDGKTAYVRANYDGDEHTVSVYKLTLNGAKAKKTEKLDEDVYAGRLSILSGEKAHHVIYFKDVDDEEGELYMDGTKIDDDVYLYSIRYNFDTNNLYYMADWDGDDELGTLKLSNGKKSTTVKDDVHTYLFTPEGECLFLYDFSDSHYSGELWIYNGKKAEKLADDVVCIIPIY